MNNEAMIIIVVIVVISSFFFPIYHWSDFIGPFAAGELMFYNETGNLEIALPVAEIYYNVTGLKCGINKNVLCDGQNLTILKEGYIKTDLSMSFEGGANQEYEAELFINDADAKDCEFHRKTGTADDIGNAGFTCLQYVYKGDKISLKVKNDNAPSADIAIHALNLNIFKINGGLDD